VAWTEARELVISLLLGVVVIRVAAAVVRAIDADGATGRVRLLVFTNSMDVMEGLILLVAAVLLCTAPAGTVPRHLRVWLFRVGVLLAGLAAVGVANVLTLPNGSGGAGKLYNVLEVGLPATTLFLLTAWLAREVVTLPTAGER